MKKLILDNVPLVIAGFFGVLFLGLYIEKKRAEKP
jgi:hypothetical protein